MRVIVCKRMNSKLFSVVKETIGNGTKKYYLILRAVISKLGGSKNGDRPSPWSRAGDMGIGRSGN